MRKAAGFEKAIAFPQRNLQGLGQHEQRLPAWLSTPGLDEADMPGRETPHAARDSVGSSRGRLATHEEDVPQRRRVGGRVSRGLRAWVQLYAGTVHDSHYLPGNCEHVPIN